MEKDIRFGILFRFYGKILTEKQYEIMESYYEYDQSLTEIAERLCVTRQNVNGTVGKACKTLEKLEEKLGFAKTTYAALDKLRMWKGEASESDKRRLDEIIDLLEE